jgi:hypothetical protein
MPLIDFAGVGFTMIADGETVPCQISDAAMDELAGAKGTPSIARQAQFVTHRDTIERMASDLFDKALSIKGALSGYSRSIFRGNVASLDAAADRGCGKVGGRIGPGDRRRRVRAADLTDL